MTYGEKQRAISGAESIVNETWLALRLAEREGNPETVATWRTANVRARLDLAGLRLAVAEP